MIVMEELSRVFVCFERHVLRVVVNRFAERRVDDRLFGHLSRSHIEYQLLFREIDRLFSARLIELVENSFPFFWCS